MFGVAGGTGSVVGGDSLGDVGIGAGFKASIASGVTDGIGGYLFDDFVRLRAALIASLNGSEKVVHLGMLGGFFACCYPSLKNKWTRSVVQVAIPVPKKS